MTPNTFAGWSMLSNAAPFFAAPLFLILFLQGLSRKPKKAPFSRRRASRHSGFSALTFSLGLALQSLETLVNHNVQHVIEERVDEDADEDGQADSDDPAAQLNRQLKRIRRGEAIDRLILRMKTGPPRA